VVYNTIDSPVLAAYSKTSETVLLSVVWEVPSSTS
jgi:hypothetical protein